MIKIVKEKERTKGKQKSVHMCILNTDRDYDLLQYHQGGCTMINKTTTVLTTAKIWS
jgi:hypothetical protein